MATKIEDRYATGLSLAADVENWLADDPVSAHRDSLVVQLQRWVRRHRTLVTSAAALVLTALVALTISYFALQAEQSRTLTAKKKAELAEKRERAEKATAKAALRESQERLAANYFQHGLSEDAVGRRTESLRDLYSALATLPPNSPVAPSYRIVYLDRLLAGGRLLTPPLRRDFGVATRLGFQGVSTAGDKTARLWDPTSGAAVGEQLRKDSVSPDGRHVVTIDDKTAQVRDMTSNTPLGEPLRHQDTILYVAFSTDGTLVVTASRDKTARLWNATSGAAVGEPLRHEAAVTSAAFSPDGTRVVTASQDKTARLWNATSGAAVGMPLAHEGLGLNGMVNSARFTQIMNLNHLAPDIQEDLLFLPRVAKGRPPINEKRLRPIAAEIEWSKQRAMWRKIRTKEESVEAQSGDREAAQPGQRTAS